MRQIPGIVFSRDTSPAWARRRESIGKGPSEVATASSEYYTRYQPLSNLGADPRRIADGPRASFRKWSSFGLMRTAKWERCGSTTGEIANESARGVSDPGLFATAKAPLLAHR